jgi:ParB family transcriptional regulator, chromosome partitioning protein
MSKEQDRVLREVLIERIRPARFQARQVFSDEVIAQLAASMKEVGQNTPLLVRPTAPPSGMEDSDDWFELVCGECRVRAAKLLGWTRLWAVVEEMSDENAALRGMVDNEQRRSLNLIERAAGYQKLMTDYHLTQEQVSERSAIATSTLSRLLALLDEPAEIQEMLKKDLLTEFQSRALDRLQDRKKRVRLAREVVERGMSAKEAARRIQKMLGRSRGKAPGKKKPPDLATDYSGFRFWWEGEEVAVRARNLRPGNSVDQYVKDFRMALLSFLENEPHPGVVQPETAMLANPVKVEPPPPSTTHSSTGGDANGPAAEPPPRLGAQVEEVAKSLKPLGDVIQEIAKTFGWPNPSKN